MSQRTQSVAALAHPETTVDEAAQRPSPISADECVDLLQTTTVGRIAFMSGHDGVQALPVNFIFRDGCIYFRTDPASIVAEVVRSNEDAAFEVDHHDDLFQLGWSVLVHGTTRVVEKSSTIAGGLSGGRPAPWAPGERQLIIELAPRTITGRRVKKRDKNWQT